MFQFRDAAAPLRRFDLVQIRFDLPPRVREPALPISSELFPQRRVAFVMADFQSQSAESAGDFFESVFPCGLGLVEPVLPDGVFAGIVFARAG